MKAYTVYSLDVLGNAEDGYDVNDSFKVGTIVVQNADSDREILAALKSVGIIANHIRLSDVVIDGDDYMITIDDAKDGRPVFTLELQP